MKPTFEEIYSAVLEEIGIAPKIFKRAGKSRVATIVRARQMICYVARELGFGTAFIGESLGITHEAVVYHHQTAQGHITWEREYSKSISKIMSRLSASPIKHKVKGWLTRDKGYEGNLSFTIGEKPKRAERSGVWVVKEGGIKRDIFDNLFSQITWESEPQECEMTLRLKKYGE